MSQTTATYEGNEPVKLNVQGVIVSDDQFKLLCQENPALQLELTARKELIIMPPTGSKTGWRNSNVNSDLVVWSRIDGTGIVFDSSTLFTLPNGAKRSPDVSWVRRERWDALSDAEQEGFAPLCPDFVVEIRSRTDRVSDLQEKMQEYIDNGIRLGWLIDPMEKRVHIYRPGQAVELLNDPVTVSGDPVLPGFVLNVRELW